MTQRQKPHGQGIEPSPGPFTFWLLRPVEPLPIPPWPDPPVNSQFGFVVRAADEHQARELAAEQALDEGGKAWLSDANSTCLELDPNDPPGVIMADSRRS